jgi:hypothetical protein
MEPLIKSGQQVTCEPVTGDTELKIGDIVLCQLGTKHYLHLIKDYRESFDGTIQAFQIGNNRGGLNGWVYRNKIYGRVIKK